MAVQFRLPDVGEGIHEAEVVRWLVHEGEWVQEFDPMVEVQTDKAIVELPAPASGVVVEIHAPAGTIAKVGDVLVEIEADTVIGAAGGETEDAEARGESAGTAVTAKAKPGAVSRSAPAASAVPEQATPGERRRSLGDSAAASRATAQATAQGAAEGPRTSGVNSATHTSTGGGERLPRPKATPGVRYFAREHGVPLHEVQGTGPDGRIRRQDVERYIQERQANATNGAMRSLTEKGTSFLWSLAQRPSGQRPSGERDWREAGYPATGVRGSASRRSSSDEDGPVPRPRTPGRTRWAAQSEEPDDAVRRPLGASTRASQKTEPRTPTRVPFRGIRRATAEHVKRSVFTAPHVTAFDECDATALVELRQRWNERLEQEGQRISYLPFIIKAVVSALRAFPYFNARLDEEAEEILLLPEYHIGIAVDTPDGLFVPVVRDADQLTVREIGEEIYRLSTGARSRTLAPEDLRGSTFTITNMGPIGGLFATPILNYPEVGILGVHQIQRKPVVVGDEIAIRQVMTLTLSFDHRVIDGAMSVRFMNHLKRLIEHPEELMLEMR
jgi:pyruvate/2-oxoglutarate dehydrogenase complex dihydrolipoamide acyltransferase (E2) component